MALTIKQKDAKWILEIREEKWQFEKRVDMEKMLKQIMDCKDKNGSWVKYKTE